MYGWLTQFLYFSFRTENEHSTDEEEKIEDTIRCRMMSTNTCKAKIICPGCAFFCLPSEQFELFGKAEYYHTKEKKKKKITEYCSLAVETRDQCKKKIT